MDEVDRLKNDGDVRGLIRFFLEDMKPQDIRAGRGVEIRDAKEAAADALAELGTPEAVDALVDALDRAPNHRPMLVEALASTEHPKALEALIRAARHHKDEFVRRIAVQTLARDIDGFDDRRDEVFATLVSALDDQAWSIRNDVVVYLAGVDDSRKVTPLILASIDPDARVRKNAAVGLRNAHDARADEALRDLVVDLDEGVRQVALAAGLKIEVRTLAEARGWPRLALEGSPLVALIIGAWGGFVIGVGVLVLFARGDFEGVLELLRGGGGGVGLIIVAVTMLGVAGLLAVNAWLKQIRKGPAAWEAWLASAADADLTTAKAKLEKRP